jgi:hypothetical protein
MEWLFYLQPVYAHKFILSLHKKWIHHTEHQKMQKYEKMHANSHTLYASQG